MQNLKFEMIFVYQLRHRAFCKILLPNTLKLKYFDSIFILEQFNSKYLFFISIKLKFFLIKES